MKSEALQRANSLLLTGLSSGCSESPLLEIELLSSSSSELLAKISSSEGPSSRGATSSSTELLSKTTGC